MPKSNFTWASVFVSLLFVSGKTTLRTSEKEQFIASTASAQRHGVKLITDRSSQRFTNTDVHLKSDFGVYTPATTKFPILPMYTFNTCFTITGKKQTIIKFSSRFNSARLGLTFENPFSRRQRNISHTLMFLSNPTISCTYHAISVQPTGH